MTIFINNQKIEIFRGAMVRDAILRYSKDDYDLLQCGRIMVFDRFGNITEPDGELTEGQVLYLKKPRTYE